MDLWNDLALFFENDFTPQAAFVGCLKADLTLLLKQNHLLLIFRVHISNSWRPESLILKYLIREKKFDKQ